MTRPRLESVLPERERFEARGIAASLGVAVGRVHKVRRAGEVLRRKVPDVPAEEARLREAIEASRAEIDGARAALEEELGPEAALVLDAQVLMHRDELLVDATLRRIVSEAVNAEWALRQTIDGLKAPMLASSASYFRERADDIEHVGKHILRHLRGGEEPDALRLGDPCIVVAADLSPADAATLLGDPADLVLAIVTEAGSATSHTAILARALEVPAIVGVVGALDAVDAGDVGLVDGLRGQVIFRPDAQERGEAEERRARYQRFTSELRARREEPVATTDGASVTFRANIELPGEASAARAHGARGIGLYRTEFLYLDRSEAPSEAEQLSVYAEVVEASGDELVVFRTFDLGGDKLPRRERLPPAPNPALGLRAFRLALRRPALLQAQVRAVLRAASEGSAALMFPLVSGLDEVRQARELVDACARELDADGLEHGAVALGVMVEVPSAALMADRIAEEVDFLSVGTNDLVQHTLAVDRTNPEVAHLAQSLDPAVLRLLRMTVDGARAGGAALSMCGDMAADPLALPVVLGLGFRTLSVPVASLPLAEEVVRRVSIADAEAFAAEALSARSAWAVRRAVRERFQGVLGDLWREQGL